MFFPVGLEGGGRLVFFFGIAYVVAADNVKRKLVP